MNRTVAARPAAERGAGVRAADLSLAHAIARVAMGVNIAMHGLVRLPDLDGFASGLVTQFSETLLPASLVYLSGYGIVFAEVVIGLLLLVGLRLRGTLVAGMALMILLLFGTCLIQNWGTASSQMIYIAYYAVLLATLGYDRYSVDARARVRA